MRLILKENLLKREQTRSVHIEKEQMRKRTNANIPNNYIINKTERNKTSKKFIYINYMLIMNVFMRAYVSFYYFFTYCPNNC